jgi:uncharacterized membrane protein required for colicin V production
MALFGLLPGGLLVAILLFLNGIAVLNEERFLTKSALLPASSLNHLSLFCSRQLVFSFRMTSLQAWATQRA